MIGMDRSILIEILALRLITVRSGESAFFAALHAEQTRDDRRVFVADRPSDMADLLARLGQDCA